MKIALVTDLHANRQAVEAVLDDARARGAQQLVFLGDYVGYGADPAWVVDRVRREVEAGALAVKGNHDAAVVAGASPTLRAPVQALVSWSRSQLDAGQIAFLDALPLQHESGEILYVHANAYAPAEWDYIGGRGEALRSLRATRCRLTFCGHLHEPRLYHLAPGGRMGDFVPVPGVPVPLLPLRRWLVLPGSAGQPRDGDPAACWALHDTDAGTLTCHRVPYDHEAAGERIRAAGLPAELAQRLAQGL